MLNHQTITNVLQVTFNSWLFLRMLIRKLKFQTYLTDLEFGVMPFFLDLSKHRWLMLFRRSS